MYVGLSGVGPVYTYARRERWGVCLIVLWCFGFTVQNVAYCESRLVLRVGGPWAQVDEASTACDTT